jgi:hypothetical protein
MRARRRTPRWTYATASRALPYVRLILGKLREQFITIWHLYRVAGYDMNNPDYGEQMRFLRDEGGEALAELDRLGVIAYQSPLRGIALFPFAIAGPGGFRKAYFVYKDSRDQIDSYIFHDVLCEHNDLLGWERSVPDAWKTNVPALDLEEQP